MNAQKIDWNDIPFVLAVCEAGTLSGAARKLGVNHSTVFRRIEGIEDRLSVTLFERLTHGYVMTAAGEQFLRNARAVEEGVNRIERELSGQDLRLAGSLTITTTDSLLHYFAPVFNEFQNKYPDVELQVESGTHSFDLMKRDADIALRPTRNPPEHWIGRRLSPISYAIYAHREYWQQIQNLSVEEHRWIRLVDELNQSPMNLITAQHKVSGAPVTVTSALMGVFDLTRAGLGMSVLPCYLGENTVELTRLPICEPIINSELWILAHQDVRRSAKVHAFFDFATKKIKEGSFNSISKN